MSFKSQLCNRVRVNAFFLNLGQFSNPLSAETTTNPPSTLTECPNVNNKLLPNTNNVAGTTQTGANHRAKTRLYFQFCVPSGSAKHQRNVLLVKRKYARAVSCLVIRLYKQSFVVLNNNILFEIWNDLIKHRTIHYLVWKWIMFTG